jgi:hypothetical protein
MAVLKQERGREQQLESWTFDGAMVVALLLLVAFLLLGDTLVSAS